VDLFSGTGIVSWAVKRLGVRIISNDIMGFAAARARCLVGNNRTTFTQDEIQMLLQPNQQGEDYIRRYHGTIFNEASMAFWRSWTANLPKLDSKLKRRVAAIAPVIVILKRQQYGHVRLSPLGTPTGGRTYLDVDLRRETISFLRTTLPLLLHDNGQRNGVHQCDAVQLIRTLRPDVLYLDPPYVCGGGTYEIGFAFYDDLLRFSEGNGHLVVNPYDTKADLQPYTRFENPNEASEGFAKLFRNSLHIPTLIISYNTTSDLCIGEIETLARDYGRIVQTTYIDCSRPTTVAGYNCRTQEILMVCRSGRASR